MAESSKITVHHLENSRSERIVWLLEELELPYELKVYKRNPKTLLAPPEAKEIHPLGKFPIVTIEEAGETTTLAESGAIVQYLVENFGDGKFAPTPGNKKEKADFLYWMHFAEGSLQSYLTFQLVTSQIPKRSPMLVYPVASAISGSLKKGFVDPNVQAAFGLLESTLEKASSSGPWVLGAKLSGPDFMLLYPITAFKTRGDLTKFPACQKWLEDVKQRDAFKRMVEKIGPVDEKPW